MQAQVDQLLVHGTNLKQNTLLPILEIMSLKLKGGHLKEYDDTKDKERIHERHASGSGL